MAKSALHDLKARNVIVSYMALRGLIERVAHASRLADALRELPNAKAPRLNPIEPLHQYADDIVKALYGTKQDWSALATVDFRRASPREVKYIKKQYSVDESNHQILTSIDKLGGHIPGARLVYDILCEFLHPNVGDLMGATLMGEASTDQFGTRHLVRKIGVGAKTKYGLTDEKIIETKLFDICVDIIGYLATVFKNLERASAAAKRLTKTGVHLMYRKNRAYFTNNDLCPCLSGLKIKDCARRSKGRL